MRLLVTRVLEDGRQTARLLAGLGHQALLAPLFDVRFLPAAAPSLENIQALIATSANGVRAFCQISKARHLPLFAVGAQTAQVAMQAGFANVRHGDGDAAALAAAIGDWARPEIGALLHLAGADSADVLAQSLAAQNFTLHRAILYEVMAADHFSAQAVAALRDGALDGALFFSPRSARHFAKCAMADGLDMRALVALCISPATAKALPPALFGEIRIAPAPNQAALLALI